MIKTDRKILCSLLRRHSLAGNSNIWRLVDVIRLVFNSLLQKIINGDCDVCWTGDKLIAFVLKRKRWLAATCFSESCWNLTLSTNTPIPCTSKPKLLNHKLTDALWCGTVRFLDHRVRVCPADLFCLTRRFVGSVIIRATRWPNVNRGNPASEGGGGGGILLQPQPPVIHRASSSTGSKGFFREIKAAGLRSSQPTILLWNVRTHQTYEECCLLGFGAV
jgi:hypothetical protein